MPDLTRASFPGLAGKVALVLGGANGIGRATAEALAASGAAVLVADVDEKAGRAVAEAVPEAAFLRTDGTEERDVEAATAEAERRFGGLHAAVTSVFHERRAPVTDLSVADWDAVVAAGLRSAFLLARASVPRIVAAGGGSLTFVSSVQARFGFAGQAPYASAKAGLSGLARQLTVEYGPRGVRANTVQPSLILTGPARASFAEDPELLARVERTFPLGRAGQPEDVAGAVAFLASDAAAFITGVDLPVDGGISVQSATWAARNL